ncbi:MAG: hypothetical protein IIB77_02440 [Proteobacteria bacterium]|nr:hypothetical protein [Pseudomonadota bacterium]
MTRLWYKNNDRSQPVELLGGSTICEIPGKPVAKGDKVVWIKPEEPKDGSAGGD